jgi:hypothetical protein
MRNLWMAVVPDPIITRVLIQDGPRQILLKDKARLPNLPAYPRALPTLCEAVALWCGRPVHAAVGVGGPWTSSGWTPWPSAIDLVTRTPLCEIPLVHPARAPRQHDQINGLGDFDDVRQVVLFEVAQ